jgi:predicted RNase H-like nuclease (RuvC/YqgF family)
MNLFIGILVSAISEVQEAKKNENGKNCKEETIEDRILSELKTMHSEIQELKAENAALKSSLDTLGNK